MRIFLGLLALCAFIAGSPYAALAINSMMGTSTVSFTDYDGSQQILTSGRSAPQPDWLPRLPSGHIVSASRWAPSIRSLDGGGTEVLTHQDKDAIEEFYKREFADRGFSIEDKGLSGLDPSTASALGMAGTITALRADTGHEVNIHIRTPNGLILRPRLVQIQWTQLTPAQKAARDALRSGGGPTRPSPQAPAQ